MLTVIHIGRSRELGRLQVGLHICLSATGHVDECPCLLNTNDHYEIRPHLIDMGGCPGFPGL